MLLLLGYKNYKSEKTYFRLKIGTKEVVLKILLLQISSGACLILSLVFIMEQVPWEHGRNRCSAL